MSYQLFYWLGELYTYLLRGKFYHFGENSIIKPFLNSSNEKYISIGNNVNIGSFCRITVSTEFGGVKCKSKNRIRIKVGNNVDIGNNTFISANNNIEVGNHVIMAPYVFLTDHDHGFLDVNKNLHEQPLTEGGYVKIGDNVFLGVKSTILKNVTIGEHSTVAANSVVTKDVPPYSIVAGNPARIIKTYNFRRKRWE
ncbi:acyltransferase [Candidatus Gottesmanbacteria bacterium]|nr:acyltransferase [Candidatus Gottesmanbacteria bacterium]